MPLDKVGVVARTEFGLLIRTRVFVLSLVLVPCFTAGLAYLHHSLAQRQDLRVRRFAVLDESGRFFGAIKTATAARPELRYEPVAAAAPRQALLDQVRRGELFAVIEVTAPAMRYYSDTPTYDGLRQWLEATLNAEIRRQRFQGRGLDAAAMQALEAPVPLQALRVGEPATDGQAVDWTQQVLPVGSMLLLFLMVMLTAPPMMSSVLEEKMSRISEVLLASVTPFELMLGKLLACCAAALLVGVLYLGLGLALAAHFGYAGLLTPRSMAYFLFFLVQAVFLNGSLYMAVGAACSQPKDAQGLLGPLVLITTIPLFSVGSLMQDPASRLATGLSYFPLSAPFVMAFRLNSHPLPPWRDLWLATLLTSLAALFCVWAASRVFRVGLLAQGKTPSPAELWHWIFKA